MKKVHAALKRILTPKETAEEEKFVKIVETIGWMTCKLNVRGRRGWADRLVLLPYGLSVLLEFKREGEPLSEGQRFFATRAGSLDHKVWVVYKAEEAASVCEKIIKRWAHEHGILGAIPLPRKRH